MDLRSCNHLHFIQAVKGGLVIKTQTVNHGRPVLKFKNLKNIYEAEDSKNLNSFIELEDEFEGFLFDSNRVKVDRPSMCPVGKRIIIIDPYVSEFSYSDDNGGSDNDLDDLRDAKMTLKQIMENCKAKKRKRLKFIDSIEELCTHVKDEAVENECDLMEPLITWKSKLSKKLKTKRRCLKDNIPIPYESASSVVQYVQEGSCPAPIKIKVEPDCLDTANGDSSLTNSNQVNSFGDSRKPREVDEIVMDCDQGTQASYSDSQNKISFVRSSSIYDNLVDSCGDNQNPKEMIEIATECDQGNHALCSGRRVTIDDTGNTSLICENQVDSCEKVPREVIETVIEYDWENQALCSGCQIASYDIGNTTLIYENQVNSCQMVPREVIETVTEHDQGSKALISLAKGPQQFHSVAYHRSIKHDNSKPIEIVDDEVDSCGAVPTEVIEIATQTVRGIDKLISLIEDPQYCVMNEVCYGNAEHHSKAFQIERDSCDDIKEVSIPKVNNEQCLEMPISKFRSEVYVDWPLSADSSRETIIPISDDDTDIRDDFPSPSLNEEIHGNIDVKEVQIPDVATNGCVRYTDSSHGSNACAADGNAKDDLLYNLETSALNSSDGKYSSDPESWITPLGDGSPMTEEKQSQISTYADVEKNCFSQILHQDASEEFMTSDGGAYSKLICPPQRLLSTRKAISPDSQDKLCKAMESIELYEEKHYSK